MTCVTGITSVAVGGGSVGCSDGGNTVVVVGSAVAVGLKPGRLHARMSMSDTENIKKDRVLFFIS